MLKIYERYPVVNINGEWERMTIFPKTCVLEEIPEEFTFYKTFEDLYNDIKSACVNTYVSKTLTFFTKEKVCYVSIADRDFAKKITKKNFPENGIQFGWEYDELKNPTMKYLFNNLSADDLIKYLKDRDISIEKVLKNN